MSEEDEKAEDQNNGRRTKVGFAVLVLEKASIGVLVFLMVFVFNTIIGLKDDIKALKAKDNEDKAQWRALHMHERDIRDIDIRSQVNEQLMQRGPVSDKAPEERPLPKPPPKLKESLEKWEKTKKDHDVEDYKNRMKLEQRQLEQRPLPPEKAR